MQMQFLFIVMIASILPGCSAGSRSLFSRLKPSEYVHPAVERGDDRPHDGRDTGVWHFACVDLFFFSLDGKASACHDLLPTKDTTPVFIFPIGDAPSRGQRTWMKNPTVPYSSFSVVDKPIAAFIT